VQVIRITNVCRKLFLRQALDVGGLDAVRNFLSPASGVGNPNSGEGLKTEGFDGTGIAGQRYVWDAQRVALRPVSTLTKIVRIRFQPRLDGLVVFPDVWL
jgi:hypothetical protein